MAALVGTEQVTYDIASGSVIAPAQTTTGAIAALAAANPAHINTSLPTAGAGSLTGTALVGSVITRSGPTTSFTDTTETAAQIITALGTGFAVNTSWLVFIRNTTAYNQTIAAGSGVTLSGETIIPPNAVGIFLLAMTSTTAISMFGIGVSYDANGGYDAASALSQFGGGTGTFGREGLLYRELSSTGIQPGGTAADNVLSVYSLPASSFDKASRGIHIQAKGAFGATSNNKRIKIIFNPSAAVVGSTITGGTTICDTGVVTTNSGDWQLEAEAFKYGAAGSNTQITAPCGAVAGSVHLGMGGSTTLTTAVESGAILVAITGNATTVVSDILLHQHTIRASD